MNIKKTRDYEKKLIIKLHNTELKDLMKFSKQISCTNEWTQEKCTVETA